ncbi:MAG: alpha/beta hydrolase [Trueperaceae bacterium]|nr:alpha/beta hydrolase [Trueperaceae bacterium]
MSGLPWREGAAWPTMARTSGGGDGAKRLGPDVGLILWSLGYSLISVVQGGFHAIRTGRHPPPTFDRHDPPPGTTRRTTRVRRRRRGPRGRDASRARRPAPAVPLPRSRASRRRLPNRHGRPARSRGSSTDWPDYGSEAAGHDLVALLDTLNAGPAVVIGNSFGAAPAVWAAAERPDLVAGLVLIGPFVRDHPMSPLMRTTLRLMSTGPWKVRAWGWFYDTLYPTEKPADHAAHRRAILTNLAEPGRFEALRAMMFRSDAAIEARLPAVRAPALVVMGSADPDFPDPAEEARDIAAALTSASSAEIAMIDGAGHYPHVELPDATAARIVRFVSDAHVTDPHVNDPHVSDVHVPESRATR